MLSSVFLSHYKKPTPWLLEVAEVESPWGPMIVVMHDETVFELWFTTLAIAKDGLRKRYPQAQWQQSARVDRLVRALFSDYEAVDLTLSMRGTAFEFSVWYALMSIPFGEVRSYAQIAQQIGRPKSVRAVANAIGKNPISWIVPCHRVVRSDGTLGGYRWGTELKKTILALESIQTGKKNVLTNNQYGLI